ncbi:CBM96 family carbohydrate-binding protein [Dyadobacter sandarakinus]|uniref:DNRLRE domain-containing protein n=1 Tax=Dyadobacter sandarakinus TaxID=2747268 RepID=A0ABX7I486_9BACT|nr:DNRLRE domain-containing protein [Dyadobacter sandarakinus]QRR00887.1 DNRLRE domain-containing protein [Dyadobacter sandarakinus]
MRKILLQFCFLILCLSLSASLLAQPAIEWDKTIGGPGGTSLASTVQTADGGYLLFGDAYPGIGSDKTDPGASSDFWVVKVDANGNKEWDNVYGGPGGEQLVCAKQTADGGYILGGNSSSDRGGDKSEDYRGGINEGYKYPDYWIIKIDANGVREWDKTLGSNSEDLLYSLEQTSDGGYIVAGSSASPPGSDKTSATLGLYDFWVVKLSADGKKLWDKSYGLAGTSHKEGIVRQLSDGGYVLAGGVNYYAPRSESDYKVFRLSADGSVIWEKTYGGTGREIATEILVTNDGGYLVGGYSNTDANGDKSEPSLPAGTSGENFPNDYWIIKLTANGTKEWDKTFGGNVSRSILYDMVQTRDNGYLLAGTSSAQAGRSKTNNSKGDDDFWIVRIDAQGNKQWDKTIGGEKDDRPMSVQETVDGGYLLGGSSYSDASGDKSENRKTKQNFTTDFWVVKLAPENPPLPQTTIRINAGGPDFTTATKKLFIADKYYAGIDRTSSIASGDILNTTNDVLYRSARSAPSFSYNIPVINGQVSVTLHFAETYFGVPGTKGEKGGTGSRRFHVNMEGSRKLTNYDIFAQAAGAMRANQITFPVTVTDETLNIDFLTGAADQPRVCAIEVVATSVTLSPLADAFVRDGSYGATNFGTSANLEIKYLSTDPAVRRASYLKFQLPAQTAVVSAKLRVYGRNHEDSKSISLHAYGVDNDSWTETGITKSNAPAASTASLGFATVTNVYQYYEIDVTSYVKAQQQAGESLVSLLLNDPNNRNTRLVFNSKEAGSNPPQLVIQTTNSAARLGQEEVITEVQQKQPSTVFPNPVKDRFTVSLSPEHAGQISFELINTTGISHVVAAVQNARPGESAEVNIAGQLFSAGIYLLKVKSDSFTEVVKMAIAD